MKMQGAALHSVCLIAVLVGGCSSGSGSPPPPPPQPHFLYTNNDIPQGFGINSISGFAVNSDGSLSPLAESPYLTQGVGNGGTGFTSSRRITITPDGKFLFAANDSSGDISAFSVNPNTGNLTLVTGSPVSTGGDGSEGISLTVTPDGRYLYASNTASGNISVLQVNNGELQLTGSLVSVAPGTFPVDIRVTADGKYLAVSIDSFNGGFVGMYSVANDGSLSQVPGSPFSDGNPPGGFTVSLDTNCAANRIYVLNNSGLPLVDVFSIGPGGCLSPISGSPFVTPGTGGGTLYLSADETRLFVGNQQNSISVFGVGADGVLTVVPGSPFVATGGAFLAGLITDPASKFVYGAGYSNRIVALAINSDGSLSAITGSPFTASPAANSGLESLAAYPPKSCSKL